METHSCLCFWKPAAIPLCPSGVIRLHWGWSAFSYPGVPTETRNLACTLAESATQEAGRWLQQRNTFLLLSLLFLLFGGLLLVFGDIYGVLAVAISVFWAMLVRISANSLVKALGGLELRLQGKASALMNTFVGAEWRLELGGHMQWIRLERELYEPPS